jgi:hypothetical protein
MSENMKIDPKPPGLISRWMFPIHAGNVIVEEVWDIRVPGCPLIANPWAINPLEALGGIVKRQREMSMAEFVNSKIPLFKSPPSEDRG